MRDREFNKNMATVFTAENGYHMIMLPDGQELNGVILTRVTDDCNQKPEVMIKMKCNIAKDKQHALDLYEDKTEYQ